MSSTPSPFPSLSKSGVTIPATPLITAALTYTQAHTSPATVNHCLRSTAFALIISTKIPTLATIDGEIVTLSTLMHDLGWATTKELLSNDKRFEVDGANLAREFLIQRLETVSAAQQWDVYKLQRVWDAISLHTTPSISLHKEPDVAAVTYGIMADFVGPNMPGGLISVEEYKEVVAAFPRLGFGNEVKQIMCNLCKEKPATTYDNFVGDFGLRFVDGYKEEWEKNRADERLMGALEACAQYE